MLGYAYSFLILCVWRLYEESTGDWFGIVPGNGRASRAGGVGGAGRSARPQGQGRVGFVLFRLDARVDDAVAGQGRSAPCH